MSAKRPFGFWVIEIFGIFLLAMLILGQTMSFIDYDFTVSLGLQEAREIITDMGVAVNKGFGVGDTIIYIPLIIPGLIGLAMRKVWGVFAMAGAFAITAYWPPVCLFLLFFAKGTPGFNFTNYALYTTTLSLVFVFGIWGFWYLYKNRNKLAEK